jgi:hypothetical protein
MNAMRTMKTFPADQSANVVEKLADHSLTETTKQQPALLST